MNPNAWLQFFFFDAKSAPPPTPDEAGEWLRWLAFHQLAAWAWHRLRVTDQFGILPAGVVPRLRQMAFQTAATVAGRRLALQEALVALRQAGIEVVLLKGAALVFGAAYADPAWRGMGDCDLWIRPAQMPAAIRVLQTLGYRPRDNAYRPPALRLAEQQEIEMIRPGAPAQVMDLHYRPFQGKWLTAVLPGVENELWRRRQPVMVGGVAVARLAAEDSVLHLAAHAAINHQMGRPGLRMLWDITTSLRAWPVDWERLLHRARAWRLRLPLYLVLRWAAEFVAAPVPPDVLPALRPATHRWALLRRLLPPKEFLRGAYLSGSHRRYLFLFALLEQPRLGLSLARQGLFPNRRWLRLRYAAPLPISAYTMTRLRFHHFWRVLRYPRF